MTNGAVVSAPELRVVKGFEPPPEAVEQVFGRARETGERLLEGLASVIFGQDDVLRSVVIALLAGGHVLLEGAPGLGKTQIVRTLSLLCGGSFSRIQFTP